jgi:GT2 family glycosyltransferase
MPVSEPSPRLRTTILIVGYRAYAELERCLASVAVHEPHVPVVVLDNAADESRGRVVTARYPRVTYVPNATNDGFAAGVNAAARRAGPGPVLLLNPDCALTGPVVHQLEAVLDAHPTVGIVGGVLLEPEGALQKSARRFPDATTAIAGRTSWLSRHLPGNALSRRNLSGRPSGPTPVDWVTGAFALIRRETFDALGGFDPRFFLYWEDADFCRRARAAGWSTMYAPTPAVVHRTARSSAFVPVRALWAFHRSAWRYYWKHGSWLARGAGPLVAAGLLGRFLLKLSGHLSAGGRRPAAVRHRESRVTDARA